MRNDLRITGLIEFEVEGTICSTRLMNADDDPGEEFEDHFIDEDLDDEDFDDEEFYNDDYEFDEDELDDDLLDEDFEIDEDDEDF